VAPHTPPTHGFLACGAVGGTQPCHHRLSGPSRPLSAATPHGAANATDPPPAPTRPHPPPRPSGYPHGQRWRAPRSRHRRSAGRWASLWRRMSRGMAWRAGLGGGVPSDVAAGGCRGARADGIPNRADCRPAAVAAHTLAHTHTHDVALLERASADGRRRFRTPRFLVLSPHVLPAVHIVARTCHRGA